MSKKKYKRNTLILSVIAIALVLWLIQGSKGYHDLIDDFISEPHRKTLKKLLSKADRSTAASFDEIFFTAYRKTYTTSNPRALPFKERQYKLATIVRDNPKRALVLINAILSCQRFSEDKKEFLIPQLLEYNQDIWPRESGNNSEGLVKLYRQALNRCLMIYVSATEIDYAAVTYFKLALKASTVGSLKAKSNVHSFMANHNFWRALKIALAVYEKMPPSREGEHAYNTLRENIGEINKLLEQHNRKVGRNEQ